MKEMKKSVAGLAGEIQDAHQAGDAGVVGAATQTHQDKSHPGKGACAPTCRAQGHLPLATTGSIASWESLLEVACCPMANSMADSIIKLAAIEGYNFFIKTTVM